MILAAWINKRTILLGTLTVVFLLSVGYLISTLVGSANRLVAEHHLKSLDYGSDRIENYMKAMGDLLATLKYDPQRPLAPEKATLDMNRLLHGHPEIQDLWLVSPDGCIVHATDSSLIGTALEDRALLDRAKSERRTVLSDCPVVKGQNNPHIDMIVPLFEDGAFRGIIGATIDQGRFRAVLRDIVLHENNMVLTVVNRGGVVVASSSDEITQGLQLGDAYPVNEVLGGNPGQTRARSPIFKDQRFYIYSPLLDDQWLLILSQPVEDVYSTWLAMLRTGGPLLLVSVSLLLWLVYQSIKLDNMRRLEALEYQAEKAHAVAELAASVAHEIRNPITAIRGFMQLLAHRNADAKTQEYVQIMVEEVDNVEATLSEFLNLAKPHTAQQEKCDLYDVLNSVYLLAQGRAINSGVHVIFNVPAQTLVRGDGMQLKQAFLNLCANAIQAMPRGGRLSISAVRNDDKVEVKITDNGEGIPAQHLKRLGERFFTTKATGTGIGLAVTYRIVRKYRGRIQVASVPGEGTEFTVTLHVWTDPGSGGASA